MIIIMPMAYDSFCEACKIVMMSMKLEMVMYEGGNVKISLKLHLCIMLNVCNCILCYISMALDNFA